MKKEKQITIELNPGKYLFEDEELIYDTDKIIYKYEELFPKSEGYENPFKIKKLKLISIEKMENKYDIQELKSLIQEHVEATGSERGAYILENFAEYLPKFKKIIPNDYKKMIALSAKLEEKGMSTEQAQMEAFYESFQTKKTEE